MGQRHRNAANRGRYWDSIGPPLMAQISHFDRKKGQSVGPPPTPFLFFENVNDIVSAN
jgi:hypothetical protein